jgi:hypothetical protein
MAVNRLALCAKLMCAERVQSIRREDVENDRARSLDPTSCEAPVRCPTVVKSAYHCEIGALQ